MTVLFYFVGLLFFILNVENLKFTVKNDHKLILRPTKVEIDNLQLNPVFLQIF